MFIGSTDDDPRNATSMSFWSYVTYLVTPTSLGSFRRYVYRFGLEKKSSAGPTKYWSGGYKSTPENAKMAPENTGGSANVRMRLAYNFSKTFPRFSCVFRYRKRAFSGFPIANAAQHKRPTAGACPALLRRPGQAGSETGRNR